MSGLESVFDTTSMEELLRKRFNLFKAYQRFQFVPLFRGIIDTSASSNKKLPKGKRVGKKLGATDKRKVRENLTAMLDVINDIVQTAQVDPKKFSDLLDRHRPAILQGNYDGRTIDAFFTKRIKELDKKIAAIPASVEKARSFLLLEAEFGTSEAALVYLRETGEIIHEDMLGDIHSVWPSSPLGLENLNAVITYRFLEAFRPTASRGLRDEIEADFRRQFSEWLSNEGNVEDRYRINVPINGIVQCLWLCSRSVSLVKKLRPDARKVLSRLLRWQQVPGYWGVPASEAENEAATFWRPSAKLTALILVCLQVFGEIDKFGDHTDKGVEWLTGAQLITGEWSKVEGGNGHILTTVLSLEAIRRNVESSLESQIAKAEGWLLSHQGALGDWSDELWGGYATVIMMEYFKGVHKFRPVPDGLLRIGREFLLRGFELSEADSNVENALAVVALYHGLEMFLYGAFSQLDPQIGFHLDNGRTIGVREALSKLRDHLVDSEIVPAGKNLSYGNQVRDLAGDRDHIVHRGGKVDRTTVRSHAKHSFAFVSTYSTMLLGFDLLS